MFQIVRIIAMLGEYITTMLLLYSILGVDSSLNFRTVYARMKPLELTVDTRDKKYSLCFCSSNLQQRVIKMCFYSTIMVSMHSTSPKLRANICFSSYLMSGTSLMGQAEKLYCISTRKELAVAWRIFSLWLRKNF